MDCSRSAEADKARHVEVDLDDSNMVARHIRDRAAQDVASAEACLAVYGRVEEAAGIGIRYVHTGARFCHSAGYSHPKWDPNHLPVLLRVCYTRPVSHSSRHI